MVIAVLIRRRYEIITMREQMIEESGLRTTDPRLQHCMDTMLDMQRDWDYIQEPHGVLLDLKSFKKYY